ncbi:C3-like protein [Salmonella enterica subsp. enterica]|uniref:C3-like protein n=1 Tax=Salmonella enterica I TaxID=59201 RepID=A0A3S4F1U6_SALET|nr:C3-like protein [Salmonella enterica subsp. enterica]
MPINKNGESHDDICYRGRCRHGIAQLNESLLERITRKLRAGWKRLGEILNQPGVPRHDHYAC